MHLSAQHCHKCESTSNTGTRKLDLLQCLTKETWNWTGLPEAARGAELHNLSVDDIITTYTTCDVIYSQVLHTTHSSLMIDSEVPKKKTAEVLICICCHNGSQMEVWGTWAGPWITISGPMKRFWTTICYNYVFCLVFLSCLFIQIKQLCKCLLTFNYDLANFSASYFDHVTFFAFRFIFFSEKKNPGIIFFTFFFS